MYFLPLKKCLVSLADSDLHSIGNDRLLDYVLVLGHKLCCPKGPSQMHEVIQGGLWEFWETHSP